jgi:hypothetical protein
LLTVSALLFGGLLSTQAFAISAELAKKMQGLDGQGISAAAAWELRKPNEAFFAAASRKTVMLKPLYPRLQIRRGEASAG